jgi:hypothetical protein
MGEAAGLWAHSTYGLLERMSPAPCLTDLAIRAGLNGALAKASTSLDALLAQADEVVLFGSRAIGRGRDTSDWDVLLVGDGMLCDIGAVHLIWRSEEQVRSRAWLESGLATHVARYGRWLKGVGAWIESCHITDATCNEVLDRVVRRFLASGRRWHGLSEFGRERRLDRLRRELQRLACLLVIGAPVPPAPVLDDLGANDVGLHVRVLNLLTHDYPTDREEMRERLRRAAHAVVDGNSGYWGLTQ